MSVILKALKKLEQENAPPSAAALSGVGAHQTRQRWGKRAFPVLAGFVLLVVIAAGTMRYVRKPLFQKSVDVGVRSKEASLLANTTPEPTPLSNRAPEPVFSGPSPEFSDVFQKKSVNNLPSGKNSMTGEPVAMPPVDAAADIGEAEQPADLLAPLMPLPEKKEENLVPFTEQAGPAIPFEAEIDGEDPPPPAQDFAPRIPAPVMPKAVPRVAVLEDPALSLQAISWSADPEKRLAIINGKICREKEHVGGYVVDAINAGEVVVSKGGRSGKLVFQIR